MKKLTPYFLVTVLAGSLAFIAGRAMAAGAPASQPLTYTGFLEENGAAVTGTRAVTLNLFDAEIGGTALCSTASPTTAVSGGRLRVPLSDGCTAVVHGHPDLWIELFVGSSNLGRTKLGAVPYALESNRASNGVPVGSVVAFAGGAVPAGWLLCDGREVSRAGVYAELFAVIGTRHGQGDGATTFNLPDYRGRFIRGTDRGALRDPDVATRTAMAPGGAVADAVGSVQDDSFESHRHRPASTAESFIIGGTGGNRYNTGLQGGANAFTDYQGGSETRPVNASADYLVKY